MNNISMKTACLVLLVAHGAIHLFGFATALGFSGASIVQSPTSISLGFLWLIAALVFFASAALMASASRDWSIAAAPAVLLSQLLILVCWDSAKWGTFANLAIFVPVFFSFGIPKLLGEIEPAR